MDSGIVFSSSSSSSPSSFALSQRVFQPVVNPRPRIQHCHSLCSSFSGVGVSTPSTWNQIKQFSHKSRSSNKLERRRPVSHTVVVAAGDVPDFLPATWSVKLPPLIPFSARTSLWKLWRCLNCARFVSNYAEEYRWWSRIWWLSDGILSAGLRRATINPLDLASM